MVVGIEKERNVDVDLKWCNAFAVGPGIDDVEGILKIVGHDCVSRTDVPFVVDAGALELLQRALLRWKMTDLHQQRNYMICLVASFS
eukprot:m.89003 g.89003  ORF g.89003 m.89003 type:complete len:87 (+) comp8822_c4_seq5:167-427(+)